MNEKKTPISLKIAAIASLPLVALTVVGLLMKKQYQELMDELEIDPSSKSKGRVNNALEAYPTKRAVVTHSKKIKIPFNVRQNS